MPGFTRGSRLPSTKAQPKTSRLNVVQKQCKSELDAIHSICSVSLDQKSKILADGTLESSTRNMNLNNPQLGSLGEFMKDLWQYEAERFAHMRHKKPQFRLTLEEKKSLRRWFSALDADGSGEVTIDELEDPLISTGILKTKEEVLACMRAWDTDNSNTISFDEFVEALHCHEGVDAERLRLLQEMSSNKQGMAMETLIGKERRRTLNGYVVGNAEKRQKEVADLWAMEKKMVARGLGRYSQETKDRLMALEEEHTYSMERNLEIVRGVADVYHTVMQKERESGAYKPKSKAELALNKSKASEAFDIEYRRGKARERAMEKAEKEAGTEGGWHDRFGLARPKAMFQEYAPSAGIRNDRKYGEWGAKVKGYRKTNLTYLTDAS